MHLWEMIRLLSFLWINNIPLYTSVSILTPHFLYSAICNSMDETGGHYAKLNKPETEGQIFNDLT